MSKIEKVPESAGKAEVLKKEVPEAVESVKTIDQPQKVSPKKEEPTVETKPEKVTVDWNKSYEDMTIEELQEAILEKMRNNGPVTDYMLRTVRENTHQGSLISWVKSFI